MTTPIIDLVTLFAGQTSRAIFNKALELCEAVGLPVTSWRIGDPSRTLFEHASQHLEASDAVAAEFAKGAYLSTATGDWLTIKAQQDYNEERTAATYASGTVTIVNSSAAVYSWDENDLLLRNTTTGKTYRNSEAVTLSGIGSTATFTYVAEEAGSDSTTAANSLTLLTSYHGVTVTSNTSGFGVDEQTDQALRDACVASLAAISPNGPSDAYEYVATNSELTGATTANKAKTGADTPSGLVTVYVSNYQDNTSGGDIDLVDDTLRRLVLPLGTEVEVVAASQADFNAVGTLTVASGPYTVESLFDDIQEAVETFFLSKKIGATLHQSEIVGAIYAAVPEGKFKSCVLSSPDVEVALNPDENPRLITFDVAVVIED